MNSETIDYVLLIRECSIQDEGEMFQLSSMADVSFQARQMRSSAAVLNSLSTLNMSLSTELHHLRRILYKYLHNRNVRKRSHY